MSRTGLLPASPLTVFADAVLQQEALACRIGEGRPPRDFAGMFVDHSDVDRILQRLPGLDGPDAEALDVDLAPVRARVAEARSDFESWFGDTEVLPGIIQHAGLDLEEAEVLAVLVAVTSDLRRQQLVAYIHDSVQLPQCTPWLLRRLFPRPHRGPDALHPPGRVWRSSLVDIGEDGPFSRRMVTPCDELVRAVMDGSHHEGSLPSDTRTIGEGLAPPGLTLVPGADRIRRAETASSLGTFLVSSVPDSDTRWSELVRAATVRQCGVMLDPVSAISPAARTWVSRANHLPWIFGSPGEVALEDLPAVPWREQPAESARVIGEDGWSLTATQAMLAAAAEGAFGGDRQRAVRRLVGGHLDVLASRILPSRGWDDLVLPADETRQLTELTARYRHRFTIYEDWGFRAVPSSGLVALFAGPSGTGKTLAAEVIAGQLALDVFKIDLSAVVSKYIGETEKNISQVFDAAEAGRVLLFFDEADALFGKRSEVSDAHDRYANIEVSYLLQRLEAYDGLVVLATNFAKNIDQAFLRRIHVSVEFPLPDEPARLDIWTRSFPDAAPREELDFPFLAAQFRLSGGSIRNAALAGAFMAAEAGTPIAMEHVVMGVKREFQKLGRLRTRDEFGPYFDLVEAPSINGGAHAEPAG